MCLLCVFWVVGGMGRNKEGGGRGREGGRRGGGGGEGGVAVRPYDRTYTAL